MVKPLGPWLAQAWQLIKEDYAASSEEIPVAPSRKKYSGSFNVRIDKQVHRYLAIEAVQADVSLNALVAQKRAESVRHSHG